MFFFCLFDFFLNFFWTWTIFKVFTEFTTILFVLRFGFSALRLVEAYLSDQGWNPHPSIDWKANSTTGLPGKFPNNVHLKTTEILSQFRRPEAEIKVWAGLHSLRTPGEGPPLLLQSPVAPGILGL